MWLYATDVELVNLAHVISLKLKQFAGTDKWSLYALMDKIDQTQSNRVLGTFPDQASAAAALKDIYEALRSGQDAYRLDAKHHHSHLDPHRPTGRVKHEEAGNV